MIESVNAHLALGRRRLSPLSFGALVVFALVAIEAILISVVLIPASDIWSLGMDYRFYRDIGARFLADGTYYLPHQMSGSYEGQLMVDVFYPPSALLLFVPFALLPVFLWWVVPIAVLVYVVIRLKPAPWAWLAMAILLAWPRAVGAYLFGNSDIWAVAAVAGGIQWGWPAAFLAIKPTFLPFALPLVRRRAFWIGLVGLAVISVTMLPLWLDYVTAMRGLRIDVGYSLGSLPLLAIPIVAWLGGTRTSPAPVASDVATVDSQGDGGAGNIPGGADHR